MGYILIAASVGWVRTETGPCTKPSGVEGEKNRKGFKTVSARVLWRKHREKVGLDMVYGAVGALGTVSPFCQAACTTSSLSKSACLGSRP